MAFRILHDDGEILAVDKPAGILVVPGRVEGPEDCLKAQLEAELGARLWVVHRLDRDVSGVLLFARTADAHRKLCGAFEHGNVAKRYWALVDGLVADDEGIVDLPLRANARRGRTVVDRERGKPSVTKYRVRRRLAERTVVELAPRTGRTHQLRVHLKAIGHSLTVDRKYGARSELRLADGDVIERATLHAEHLAIGAFEVSAELPSELARLVEGVG